MYKYFIFALVWCLSICMVFIYMWAFCLQIVTSVCCLLTYICIPQRNIIKEHCTPNSEIGLGVCRKGKLGVCDFVLLKVSLGKTGLVDTFEFRLFYCRA